MEEKEEVVKEIYDKPEKEENYSKKEKGKVGRIIWNVVFYSVLAVFAFCAIFGVINFNKVKDGEEPNGYSKVSNYVTEDNKTVTVYNYYVYKIVKAVENGKETVSLKLWFLDDVK